MSNVLVVTVGYNSAAALKKYCKVTPVPSQLRFVVVDNQSVDDTISTARGLGAETHQAESNEGFGRACNLGVSFNRGEEWLVFLNPDVAITSEQILALVASVPADTVAVSPLLVSLNGTVHADIARRSPTAWTLAALYLFGARAGSRDRAEGRRLVATGQDVVDVEVTSGACLAVRRAAFEDMQGFPPWIFLNYEDVYLCDQLLKVGRVTVNKGIVALHEKAGSSSEVPPTGRSAETARAACAYAAGTMNRVRWLIVVLAALLGSSMRWLRTPSDLRLVPRLCGVVLSEGGRIRRGKLTAASAEFI